MSKKRRMFDIELPEDIVAEEVQTKATVPEEKTKARRGPMATAISENAESLRERQALESEIRAENDALAHEYVRLKKLGLVVDLVALDAIKTSKLVRDRSTNSDMDLSELKSSIMEIGLSNPIRVEVGSDGRYELIQGLRRLSAYRELLVETKDDERFGRIPAGIVASGESVEDLYRKMVDENLVRKDISFAEMAMLAINYAADTATSEDDPDKAVAILFKSASYQKRSYIRSFIRLMAVLEGTLLFPEAIPRALGLSLLSRMEQIDGVPTAIKTELDGWADRSLQDELDVLRKFADGEVGNNVSTTGVGRGTFTKAPRKAKTTFQIERPEGAAKCIASTGRLEIRLSRDFSAVDRRKLEKALKSFLDQIG